MNNREFIKEKFEKLPKNLKAAIIAVDYREKITRVGKNFQLNTDKIVALENEITFVMTGLEHPSKFIGNIAKALNLPEEKARAIAEDINTEIFRPVRESLKKIHGITSDQQPTTSNPQPITQTTPVIPAIPKPPSPIVPKPPIPPPPTTDLQPTTYNQQPKLAEKEKTPLERTTPGGHYENGENHLNREEILAGIENPTPARPTSLAAKVSLTSPTASASKDIVQDKLEGMVRMPKSEQDITASIAASASLASKKEEPPKPSYQADPYREPLG